MAGDLDAVRAVMRIVAVLFRLLGLYEDSVLDRWIGQQYEKTPAFVAENPVEADLALVQDET